MHVETDCLEKSHNLEKKWAELRTLMHRERMTDFEVSNGASMIGTEPSMACAYRALIDSDVPDSPQFGRALSNPKSCAFRAALNSIHSLTLCQTLQPCLVFFFVCNYVSADSLARCLDRTPKKLLM